MSVFFMHQRQGDGAYRFKVMSNVFAGHAVPARGPQRKPPPDISQRGADPVDLQLRHIFYPLSRKPFDDTLVPLFKLVHRIGVIQRIHFNAVGYGCGAGRNFRAHALARRIKAFKVREPLFELDELAQQIIVFLVGDRRLIEDIVPVIVPLDLSGQPGDLFLGLFLVHT